VRRATEAQHLGPIYDGARTTRPLRCGRRLGGTAWRASQTSRIVACNRHTSCPQHPPNLNPGEDTQSSITQTRRGLNRVQPINLWLAGINQSQPLTHMYPPSRSGCIASQRTSPIQDRWRHPLSSTPKIQSCFVGLWLPTPTLAPYCSGGDGGGDGTRGGLCSGKAPALLSSAMTDAVDGVASITHVGSDVL
jgi:hypothetical protein